MLRRCAPRLAAADVASLKFDAVVVGGGTAGCLIAGKLGMEDLKTLVIEEGDDVRNQPEWFRTLPASQIAHRVAQRGYEAKDTVTVPQKQLDGSKAPVWVPTARVLGGKGVMGSRSWNLGSASDWEGTPWDFREDLLPRIRLNENMEMFAPHRGKRGKFLISRPQNFSPYFKPFCEAASHDVPLISEFTRQEFDVRCGCGRPDMFADLTTGKAHSTLQRYLIDTIKLNRPIRVECNSKVIGIRGGGESADMATGVSFRRADGQLVDVEAPVVIVSAGAIGSPRLLAASKGTVPITGPVGSNYWDVPQVVLQYRTKDRQSHNAYLDPLVRSLLKLELRFGSPNLSMLSSWDDLITYWSSTGSTVPDVEILFQPFTLNNDGTQPLSGEHGCQFVVRPIRPKSRGTIGADGSIDPNYFGAAEDLEVLSKAVEYVKESLVKKTSLIPIVGALVNERLESSGVSGGSCLEAIDPVSFAVKGMSNVYVCDDSILPAPLTGSTLPYTMTLAEKFTDKLLKRKDVRAKVEENPDSGATRIIY